MALAHPTSMYAGRAWSGRVCPFSRSLAGVAGRQLRWLAGCVLHLDSSVGGWRAWPSAVHWNAKVSSDGALPRLGRHGGTVGEG